jgi:hypothetical protein
VKLRYILAIITGNVNENNWIIRIQDGKHFFQQAHNGIWAIRNITKYQNILKKFKKGDNIWFMQKKTSKGEYGKLTAYGKYDHHFIRDVDLIDRENKERGWDKHAPIFGGTWGIEIRFTEFKDLRKSTGFVTGIKSTSLDAVMPRCIYETHIDFDSLKARLNNM